MAKASLLAQLLGSGAPPAPKAKKAKAKAPVKQAMPTPVDTPSPYKEPTPGQRMKMSARDEKVHATRRWVSGDINDKQHAAIHQRANQVLKGKAPGMKK
jgi:hypothetical protein